MTAATTGSGGGANPEAIQKLWADTVERVKKVAFSPTLYRALERTVPVTWEENFFVVGFHAADGQMAGSMNTGENQAIIERALRALSGDQNIRLRIISGDSYADWEQVKNRDAAALASRTQAVQKRATENAAFNTWDQVYEQVSRLWANSEYRSLPTGRGRYFDAAFDLILKAMEALYPTEGTVDEATERGLSRVIERVASMSNADAAIIGYLLLERYKARKQ